MRLVFATTVVLVAAGGSGSAMAQGAPSPGGGQTITRDQFIQRQTEAAGRRFDMIDVNHTGVITRAQLRAFRQAHQPGAAAQ